MVKSELFQKLWAGIEDMVLQRVSDAMTIHEEVYHYDEDEEHDDGYGCETCGSQVAEKMLFQTVNDLRAYIGGLEEAVRILGQIIAQEKSYHNGKKIWENYSMSRERVNECLAKAPAGYENIPRV